MKPFRKINEKSELVDDTVNDLIDPEPDGQQLHVINLEEESGLANVTVGLSKPAH